MTEITANPHSSKSQGMAVFNFILLGLCLCIIAVRLFLTEGLNAQQISRPVNLVSGLGGIVIPALLFFLFLSWLICQLWRREFSYRFTGMEIGLFLFAAAVIISAFAAADKRAAVTNAVTVLAPMFMTLVLIQILDSNSKVKLVLYAIAVAGAITAVYCAIQFFWINSLLIEQYQADPNAVMAEIGILPGSFRHMLFENSLYSRDVRGFFITGNSAGSFALLAIFSALGLLCENIGEKNSIRNWCKILAVGSMLLIIVFGLVLTRSKGALAAGIMAAVCFALYLAFGNWLKAHKGQVLLVCLLAALLIVSLAVGYGSRHGRLPGGNSMLVRWQYWQASAKMYADRPLSGIGGGNFANFYPQYKPASAPEAVADPHSFLLALLTQYGPLGLAGFLLAVFIPLGRIIFADSKSHSGNLILPALLVGILGFLLHNCVDFAIFEPSILTVFWVVTACLTALNLNDGTARPYVIKSPIFHRILITAIVFLAVPAGIYYAFLPVIRVTAKINLANRAARFGQLASANKLLSEAADIDSLNYIPSSLNGRMYLHRYRQADRKDGKLLLAAEKSLLEAAARNGVDFKNFERLTETYNLLAEQASLDREHWLKKAFVSAQIAVRLYPGCGRLRVQLAKIAEALGETDVAIKSYEKAVEIEDSYREQFKLMYPGREIFSRLGEDVYRDAIQKIESLSESSR